MELKRRNFVKYKWRQYGTQISDYRSERAAALRASNLKKLC
jgi:hypothetical protein